jgi:Ca2+-binding RTX toxin-like protein
VALAFRVRPMLGLLAASVALCFLAAAPARAATTIGDANNAGSSCTTGLTINQGTSAPGSPSYTVPAGGGVIVSWRYQAGVLPDQIKFLAIRPISGSDFRVVHVSAVQTMTPNTVNTIPTRVPVQAGDTLAIHIVSDNATCANITGPPAADRVDGCPACDPAEGGTYTSAPVQTQARVNVAASVEPDADHDGFGDETQDQCFTDPSTQGSCPTPTISGVARANSTLTATPGGQPTNPAFQWLRCDAAGANCSPIPGATGTTYAPGGADVGHTLRFRKTATSSGAQSAESAATRKVAADPKRCSTLFTGTSAADTIVGTSGGDRILGLGASDRVTGGRGRDCLSGQSGNDRLSGGSAADSVSGGSGRDRLSGGSGNDRISGGSGNDRVSGGSGADRLSAGGGKNVVSAGSGNDVVNAANGKKDVVNCGSGRRDRARVDASDVVRRCERVRVRG